MQLHVSGSACGSQGLLRMQAKRFCPRSDRAEPNTRAWIYIDGSDGWRRMDRQRYEAAGTQLSEAVDACHAARRRQGGRRLPDSHEAVQRQ
jgi:hypothetical protein